MADTPNWDHIGRIVNHCRDLGMMLECLPLSEQRTLSAAYLSVHECEKRNTDIDTHRHAAEVLLQGFMQATDNMAAPGTPKGIHLGAIRIFAREALRQLIVARA